MHKDVQKSILKIQIIELHSVSHFIIFSSLFPLLHIQCSILEKTNHRNLIIQKKSMTQQTSGAPLHIHSSVAYIQLATFYSFFVNVYLDLGSFSQQFASFFLAYSFYTYYVHAHIHLYSMLMQFTPPLPDSKQCPLQPCICQGPEYKQHITHIAPTHFIPYVLFILLDVKGSMAQ